MLAIATLLVLGASAPIAAAGPVSFEGDTLVFTAVDSLSHEVQIRFNAGAGGGAGGDDVLDNQPITAPDCTPVTATRVSCPPHNEVRVDLGAGNDSFTT
jgi:hypothetical protein